MLKKFSNKIIIIAIISFVLSGCYKTEVAPIVEPGGLGYTSVTITPDKTGTEVTEGDTIVYSIVLSKPVDYDLKFTVKYTGCYASDLIFEDVTIPAYSTEGEMPIVFNADNIPEVDRNITVEIGDFEVGRQSNFIGGFPVFSLSLKNLNNPGGLTVSVGWADDNDDWDAYLIDEAGAGDPNGWGYDFVGYDGATGADPEILDFLEDYYGYWTAPDGNYFVDVDPYDVAAAKTDLTFRIGYPDGKVDSIKTTFDMAKKDTYPMTWGYSVLKIVKSAGLKYTVSLLPEYTANKSAVSPMKQRGNFVNMKNVKK